MKIRFNYSERISAAKLISSIKEILGMCVENDFRFDIVCKNEYIVSIVPSDEVYNSIVVFRRIKNNYNSDNSGFSLVRSYFFDKYDDIASLRENSSDFKYAKNNVDKMLEDAIYLVKFLYMKDQVDILR